MSKETGKCDLCTKRQAIEIAFEGADSWKEHKKNNLSCIKYSNEVNSWLLIKNNGGQRYWDDKVLKVKKKIKKYFFQ
jgi:hypothetical protein